MLHKRHDLKKTLAVSVILMFALVWSAAIRADESDLFTSVAPDALIVLDLSGSMADNPTGGSQQYGDSSCSGPFYSSSGSGHTTDCRKVSIAKRAIFNILDDNASGTIDSHDETSLNVRVGYMRFYNCNADDTGLSYTSGCNSLAPLSGGKYTVLGTKYSDIWSQVNAASATGGTPLASALNEARLYLNANKAADSAGDCRQKFVILITDGADTFACSGDGTETQSTQYKRRRESVAAAKALADAGYKVFVIGFGSGMPDHLEKTLNWMAYFGGTDNPNVVNSGDTTAFAPSAYGSCTVSTTTGTCNGTSTNCFATSNDPGTTALSGYAFLASNADDLAQALKATINIIREANYSFSQSSVQSSRTSDENYLYEGSFQPVTNDPFWHGHLKKYQINTDGTVGSMLLDAGDVLQGTAASGRTGMKTCIAGSLTSFTTSINRTYFGVSTDSQRDAIVGYIRGDSASNPENWKLGDIFRSTPITVGTPSSFYYDIRDTSSYSLTGGGTGNAFAKFRSDHKRQSINSDGSVGTRLIVAGANDGQMHAFYTGNMQEAWSFLPPNLLPKLKNITHATHPTSLTHQYFVDGPVTVADVWIPSTTGATGTNKSPSEWRTLMIFGEGRGGTGYLWSSSANCDTGFATTYSTDYPNYCGFFFLNITDSTSPSLGLVKDGAAHGFLKPTASQAPYLGDPWSKMMIGKVKIGTAEKWVGFIGAGFNSADCSGGGSCDARGKGFFVVDLKDGTILWDYTYGNYSSTYTSGTQPVYGIPAPPAIVDSDNDGFIDTAYIGDLGGNVWRFNFCRASDGDSCGTANWAGGKLYDSSTGTIRPIYTTVAAAVDPYGHLWVYWGTGDKSDPTAPNAQEKFFALKDLSRTATYRINDLDNITSGTYDPSSAKNGWYINLSGSGEKILADPVVFGGNVYFTTYNPGSGGNPCDQAGSASLYAVNYITGGGLFTSGARSRDIGNGIASAPVISLKPDTGTPDLYVTVSGGAGTGASTSRADITPPNLANRRNLLFWKDRRLQ